LLIIKTNIISKGFHTNDICSGRGNNSQAKGGKSRREANGIEVWAPNRTFKDGNLATQ